MATATSTSVQLVALVVPGGVDQRVIQRALAVGLRQQGWTPRSRGERFLAVGGSDEDADELIQLARRQLSVPAEVFQFENETIIRELEKIVFQPLLPGGRV